MTQTRYDYSDSLNVLFILWLLWFLLTPGSNNKSNPPDKDNSLEDEYYHEHSIGFADRSED